MELGQLWRSFPVPSDAEVDHFREQLTNAGGRVSIVGASIDDWRDATHRRTESERLAFLLPQVRAAHRLGADGIRLPIGQAGPELTARLLPILHELEVTLYEEVQGQQSPTSPHAADYAAVAALDDPRVRLLVDISMLMPALPITYLDALAAGGVPAALIAELAEQWRAPETLEAVVGLLRAGAVPGPVHTLFMNLLVRFGRSDAADLAGIAPLVGGVHLKFWDLDDRDGRISRPIAEFGELLRAAGYAGTLTSEWGGHEWLDDDPAEMTRAHLALAQAALGRRR
ncbi:hypothetical protein GCM10025738_03080 [Microbacterium fluvii]